MCLRVVVVCVLSCGVCVAAANIWRSVIVMLVALGLYSLTCVMRVLAAVGTRIVASKRTRCTGAAAAKQTHKRARAPCLGFHLTSSSVT